MSARNKLKPELPRQQEACASALRNLGIDEAFVMEELKKKLEAKDRRWNHKKKSWEKFHDRSIQLAAAREIAKISGAYRLPKNDNDDVPEIIANITPSEPEPSEGSGADTIERRRP